MKTGSGKSENVRLAMKTLLELSVRAPLPSHDGNTQRPNSNGHLDGHHVPHVTPPTMTATAHLWRRSPSTTAPCVLSPIREGKASNLGVGYPQQCLSPSRLKMFARSRTRGGCWPSGERNIHVFYYLMASVSLEELATNRHQNYACDASRISFLRSTPSGGSSLLFST